MSPFGTARVDGSLRIRSATLGAARLGYVEIPGECNPPTAEAAQSAQAAENEVKLGRLCRCPFAWLILVLAMTDQQLGASVKSAFQSDRRLPTADQRTRRSHAPLIAR